MRKEYDFSKASKNPYAAKLSKQITIRLDEDSIGFFKEISEQLGIPYQSLINRGCTEFCVNGLMAGNRRISRSGYDLKHKESSTQRSH